MTERPSEPQDGGALVPARPVSPATPIFPAARPGAASEVGWRRDGTLGALVTAALDGLDALGDRLAEAAGLR